MERIECVPLSLTELAISDMMWEGGPPDPIPDSVVGLNNSQFPERGGDRLRVVHDGVGSAVSLNGQPK